MMHIRETQIDPYGHDIPSAPVILAARLTPGVTALAFKKQENAIGNHVFSNVNVLTVTVKIMGQTIVTKNQGVRKKGKSPVNHRELKQGLALNKI